ncbi:hypothetical protein [Pseudomonas aeruginosa]|uniref:hypothetical protein n=1 Tax=Pseudomonas aeruginosa TaxID=287 RepID=UPI0014955894|nr:hypothetical protein [Pseudomonas aeruginosa]NPS73173.1 hypothetical protein [Pseudomonas aeruginosa]
MIYEVDEILNEAVMTGVPSIIVEGIDDICIYEGISKKSPFLVEVYAVEYIDGFGEGCDEVVRAVSEIEQIPSSNHKVSDHVLGVIDKDVRDFRNELPESDAVLTLKYYSIESHFVSKAIIQHTLSLCTRSTQELVTEELCDFIMSELEPRLLKIYYHCLESLKNAVVRDYDAAFAYSYNYGRLRDTNAQRIINEKKEELDIFAASMSIDASMESIKRIARGKWLIEIFSEELLAYINGLQKMCKDGAVSTCKCCLNAAFDKCLYRIREGIGKNAIKGLAFSNTEGAEFGYIVQRISSLKGSVQRAQAS